MKEVQFKELKVGDKFILNDIEYIRAEDKRISCCRTLNAYNAANPGEKIQVKPLIMVKIDDQLQ